jgi:glycosyltransferase involved in cell wall biosynthesis
VHNKKYILWVGRCNKGKRPELFLRIVKKFPKEKFIMISPMVSDERDLFDQIKQEASQLTNLVFIERVSFFEIQKYFNEAKIFLGTSDYEGFPNTYLQACLGGTPIISLRVNPDNFITENNLGYCANGKLDLMLDKINYILNHPDDWLEKSRNALKYVKKNHNINIIGKKWRAILEKLTDN